jgi:hypothetical protein
MTVGQTPPIVPPANGQAPTSQPTYSLHAWPAVANVAVPQMFEVSPQTRPDAQS